MYFNFQDYLSNIINSSVHFKVINFKKIYLGDLR